MLAKVKAIAKSKNIAGKFSYSDRAGKRFKVVTDKTIHFGSDVGQTFIDHGDEQKRKAWRARHSKIMRDGKPAYKNKDSPSYYSWNLLW